MPVFVYQAVDSLGHVAQGTLMADSRAAALNQLQQRNLVPVSVIAQRDREQNHGSSTPVSDAAKDCERTWWSPFGSHVNSTQVQAFTRELANLLTAGVPLGKALHILRREASHPAAKRQWSAVHDEVVGGKPLADALARWPQAFPPVYVAMIRAGETGGFLEMVLHQIADFRARESELLDKVKAAMVYPAVLACLAVVVVIGLLTFFIPRFSTMFADFGAALPWLTQAILDLSSLLLRYGWLMLLAGTGLVLVGRRWLRGESGKRWLERWLLAVPMVGAIVARFALVRFSRMLGTLLSAGVPLVTALRVAREALGNQTLADAVQRAMELVKQGNTLSQSLATCAPLFPPSVVEMVAIAEESGRLDKELLRLAQTYELELDRRLRILVSLAEPLLLFAMASVIGTIVIGMLLPIFTLQELIQ